MEELKPQPGLRKLEIDTGWATSEAVEFIVKSPRIENLQLHRTAMTDQDLRTILAALPELRILEIRPHGQNRNKGTRITGASLQGLAHARKLECLAMSLEWGEMPYEGGLETLVGLEHLRQIDISPGDIKGFSIDDPAIRRLHEARPDIRIQVKNKSVGGGTDFKRIEKDGDEWNWDHGVNTHG